MNVIEVMLVLLRIPRIYEVVTATISGSKLDRLRRKSGQEEGDTNSILIFEKGRC